MPEATDLAQHSAEGRRMRARLFVCLSIGCIALPGHLEGQDHTFFQDGGQPHP